MKKQKTISGTIDAEKAALMELLLKKAKLTVSDIIDTTADVFINKNIDLLTKDEKEKFKKLFFNA